MKNLFQSGMGLIKITNHFKSESKSIIQVLKRLLGDEEYNRILQENRKVKDRPITQEKIDKALKMFRERVPITTISRNIGKSSIVTREIIINNMTKEEFDTINSDIENKKKSHQNFFISSLFPHMPSKQLIQIKSDPILSEKIEELYFNDNKSIEEIALELKINSSVIFDFLRSKISTMKQNDDLLSQDEGLMQEDIDDTEIKSSSTNNWYKIAKIMELKQRMFFSCVF